VEDKPKKRNAATLRQPELTTRVNRIAGQVAGIGRMIEKDEYCVDILNQIAAARSALDALGVQLLTRHLESCVLGHGTDTEHACAKPMTQEQLVEEVRLSLSRFLK
jgi:DNA-binding FrmR family transcriptional regulator